MTSRPQTLTPRTIGETENALRATLAQSLADTDLDYHEWAALKLVSESHSPIPLESAVGVMTNGLKITEIAAGRIIDGLSQTGVLATSDGELETTDLGRALYERVNHRTTMNTRAMWEGLTAEDLATTHRVLSQIRDRANSILAAS